MKRRATITGIGKYAPEKILTNEDLEKMVDTSDEWITSRTGMKKRHIVQGDETTADIGYQAAVEALNDANINSEDLDLIIFSTVTPDMLFPATACLLADRLNAGKIPAFDLEAGCSGFVYGISVAAQFIETGLFDNILVVGSETLSKITDWEDRSTCVLFGDGAGAAVLQPTNIGGLLAFDLGSDGSGGKYLKLPAAGSLMPASIDTIKNREHFIKMEGNPVFKFAVKIMGQSSLDVIKKAGLNPKDVDLFIPHQANIRIIKAAANRLNLTDDKVFVNLPEYGNTSSASIPIALAEAKEAGLIKNGQIIVLVAFGAGLTWASTIIDWNEG